LADRLKTIRLPGVEVFVEPVKEHRFVLVLRGPHLSGRLSETDPQAVGVAPLPVIAQEPAAAATAELVNRFIAAARQLLRDATPRQHWDSYDFFFVHYKDTDKAGEDGDFTAKVAALERFDAALPSVLELAPDVVIVTGDHASPSILAGHGWQPVPVLIGSRYCGADPVTQ